MSIAAHYSGDLYFRNAAGLRYALGIILQFPVTVPNFESIPPVEHHPGPSLHWSFSRWLLGMAGEVADRPRKSMSLACGTEKALRSFITRRIFATAHAFLSTEISIAAFRVPMKCEAFELFELSEL
jgi:hypothetical protein